MEDKSSSDVNSAQEGKQSFKRKSQANDNKQTNTKTSPTPTRDKPIAKQMTKKTQRQMTKKNSSQIELQQRMSASMQQKESSVAGSGMLKQKTKKNYVSKTSFVTSLMPESGTEQSPLLRPKNKDDRALMKRGQTKKVTKSKIDQKIEIETSPESSIKSHREGDIAGESSITGEKAIITAERPLSPDDSAADDSSQLRVNDIVQNQDKSRKKKHEHKKPHSQDDP